MSKELTTLTKEPDEGTPYTKNLSAFKGVFLGGKDRHMADGLKDPVNWLYEYNPGSGVLTIEKEDGSTSPETVLTDIKELENISVVFDRQMQLVVTYVRQGVCYIWSYDPVHQEYRETELEGRHVKATLSSHYRLHAPFSEVVIGYVKDDKTLCIRLQRDRYTREYVVQEFDTKITLHSISYTDKNRFQYEILEHL